MNVTIYGRDGCTSCNKAKMLCEMKSVNFDYLTVPDDISAEQLRERVGNNVTTLPQIFLNQGDSQQYVGGYDELRAQL